MACATGLLRRIWHLTLRRFLRHNRHRSALSDVVEEMFAHVRGHADAALARGIAGEKSGVHANPVGGDAHGVFHVGAFVFAAFGYGVFPAVHIAIHDIAGAIPKTP
jgi:hypothetical protein